VNGNLAVAQGGQLLLVVIHENDFVSKVSETGACDQSDVSGAYHGNAHRLFPLL
jgi:hypothetical protein